MHPHAGISSILVSQCEGYQAHLTLLIILVLEAKYNLL